MGQSIVLDTGTAPHPALFRPGYLSADLAGPTLCSMATVRPAAEPPCVLIVGAGPAGLAVAAQLGQQGVPYTLLEQTRVASSWHQHYERLHLHTAKAFSGLPGMPMPRTYPQYPSRQQVIEYLEAYVQHFGIEPRLGQQVSDARRAGDRWQVTTRSEVLTAPQLIVATGYCRVPKRPSWPGQDTFQGRLLHSSAYRSGRDFQGQQVLVVGMGNSGAEIALDLSEQGAHPTISVRRPVNILPRDVLGIPSLALGLIQQRWPAPLADAVNAPLVRALIGNLAPYGLPRPRRGAISELRHAARVPVFDIGTVKLIKTGQLAVRPAIESFTPAGVIFTGGRADAFDAVILATGFAPGLSWLHTDVAVKTEAGIPLLSGRPSAEPGLYFCGFHVSPTGMLREIGREARQIAAAIPGPEVRGGSAADHLQRAKKKAPSEGGS